MEIDPSDVESVRLMRLAATGDAAAQLELARTARQLVITGDADEIVCSIEGLTYARLAAAQGVPDALMLVAEHCAHLANVYAQCGEQPTSDMWQGQTLGVLELATEMLPPANAADLMASLNIAADNASPAIMQEAKLFRAIFAPAFGAEAFA